MYSARFSKLCGVFQINVFTDKHVLVRARTLTYAFSDRLFFLTRGFFPQALMAKKRCTEKLLSNINQIPVSWTIRRWRRTKYEDIKLSALSVKLKDWVALASEAQMYECPRRHSNALTHEQKVQKLLGKLHTTGECGPPVVRAMGPYPVHILCTRVTQLPAPAVKE